MSHKLECKKCGKRWLPHVENPQKCPAPKCQSYEWATWQGKARKTKADALPPPTTDQQANAEISKTLIP